MKFVTFAALGAVLASGAFTVAQAQTPAAPQGVERGIRRHGSGEFRQAFADLGLTDQQKAQIKTIREKYRAQHEAARKAAQPELAAAKAARDRGDTAAARAAMERFRAAMQASKPVRDQEL